MKSKETRKLVHDLSRGLDISYYTTHYSISFLRKELTSLAERVDYPYEPARLMLEALKKKYNEKV